MILLVILKIKVISQNVRENLVIECSNFVSPICDCILRGFEGHSEQLTEDFEKYNK